jgi:hypothetical protein
MKNLLKYLPYILIVVAVFVGRWTAPQPDKDLLKRYEVERKYHIDQISKLNAQADDLAKAGLMIAEKRQEDSLKTAIILRAKDSAFIKLKKENEKITLSRASVAELDSARAIVIALHPVR